MIPLFVLAVGLVLLAKASQAAIVLTNATASIDVYDLRIDGTFGEFIIGTAPIVLPLTIHNEQPISATVQRFTGAAYLGGEQIAPINVLTPAIIPAAGSVSIDIPIYLAVGPAIGALVAAISSGDWPTLTITGTLTVNDLPLPINEPLKLLPS